MKRDWIPMVLVPAVAVVALPLVGSPSSWVTLTLAGLAMGLTLPQTYRFVLLPVAFRVVIPPLTSESMNIVKNSSVAFAISVLELTQFARQAGEETSRPMEIYAAVTLLYFVSAFSMYLIASAIERAVKVPGVAAGGGK